MIMEYEDRTNSNFEGTIIDIETTGDFDRSYNDSRQYADMVQVILGYINQEHLKIYCAKDQSGMLELRMLAREIIGSLNRPFYAFNSEFEMGIFFHYVGIEVKFDGELNLKKYESKKDAVRKLKIPNYDDPFFDSGKLCMKAWNDGEFDKAVAHNRACLLKERDILIKRQYREPDQLVMVRKED